MSSFTNRDARDLAEELQPLLDYEQVEANATLATALEEQIIGCAALLDEAETRRGAEFLRRRADELHDRFVELEARIESGLDYETRMETELERRFPERWFPEPPRSSWA